MGWKAIPSEAGSMGPMAGGSGIFVRGLWVALVIFALACVWLVICSSASRVIRVALRQAAPGGHV